MACQEAARYGANSQGFALKIREPEWEERRALRGGQPPTNLHVFSRGAREPRRHVLFRDWLRNHPQDRDRYEEIKRHVAADGYTDAMLYNNAKAWFIHDLYEVILTVDPAHQHDPQPRHPRTPAEPSEVQTDVIFGAGQWRIGYRAASGVPGAADGAVKLSLYGGHTGRPTAPR